MGEITFRPARPEDTDSLFEVKIAAYGDEFRRFRYAEEGRYREVVEDCRVDRARSDGMFSREWHEAFCRCFGDWTLVIEVDSRIVGSICAQPGRYFQEVYPEYDMSANVNVLFCIYVLPAYQDRGLGSKAMAHMEELHPAAGWILDTPEISPKNRHFYEKGGYTRDARGSCNVYTKGLVPQRGHTAEPST